jgi:enoyl-CoA hydratase
MIDIERRGEIAILHMNNGRANAIGAAFLDALDGAVGSRGDARAVVLVGYEGLFSAGLDLPSLVDLDDAHMRKFIARFAETMLRVFELPIPVVAAVNGHAVAGGCVLALQADVRIAADRESKIGLNEVALGIGLPAVVMETLRCQVPPSSLVPIALEGRLVPPKEALALGLVEAVVPSASLLETAVERARAMAALPPVGFAHAKNMLRRPVADAIRAASGWDAERWVATWRSPDAQVKLRAAVAKLGRKG